MAGKKGQKRSSSMGTDTSNNRSADSDSAYSEMSGYISTWDIPEAQGFYSDRLTDEETYGVNHALADYLLSGLQRPTGRGARFIYALLNHTVKAEKYLQAEDDYEVHVFYAEGYDKESAPDDGSDGLVNLSSQIVYELDKMLEQMHADCELRNAILEKVEAALYSFITQYSSDRRFLELYARCLEKLLSFASYPGVYRQRLKWLKRSILTGRLLVKENPQSKTHRKRLAHSLFSLGIEKRGKPDARACFQEALGQLLQLQEMGDNSSKLLRHIADCYESIGDTFSPNMYENLGKRLSPATARTWYMKSLELREQLMVNNSRNYDKKRFAWTISKFLEIKRSRVTKLEIFYLQRLLVIANTAKAIGSHDTELRLLIQQIERELLDTDRQPGVKQLKVRGLRCRL